ncbi:hypothetical protein TRAPUB_8703 [Trametes pubescens]|uniref:DUF6533 domain-containing protein n=1 Tax=Trametes pubescens TaxID=154538 RepID=A0A1M2W4D6_TRAPU|nr:hypothetical protein TRAPUB_8703 [Trametes pubescens]
MSTVIPGEVIIESNYTNRILSSVAFALLYYDFVLTIPQEVERYWERKFSLPSFLFFLNRCREFQQYHRFISMVIQGVVAALMLLRTYALYGQDRRILVLLSTIIGTGAIISVWVLVAGHHTRRPTVTYAEAIARTGCDLTLSQEEGYDLAIAWSAILVFDAVVFILTLLQALKAGGSLSGSYLRVMLRDDLNIAKPVHKGVSTSITNVGGHPGKCLNDNIHNN